ncbi:MAG: 16S rRNA (uracil(1498)-N(3))-methyltransferase [Gammaproteobacteria bacterium RIFCSPHIGHO2_12_FULL_42_10]|nr:MAG: 16S rRNA (uracil(1498)-N(3))-methyltransferase [Gammaproteobacteria bacterium RIFCSPHIGHO2_12_FULL_42_10]
MSSMRSFQSSTLTPNTTVLLDDRASHHIAHVLRKSLGDEIVLFNGDGYEYVANIIHLHKKGVTVAVAEALLRDRESPLDLILAQGIARGDKMDFILQKSVELGVAHIYPLITAHSHKWPKDQIGEKRLQHWQSVVTSACEQSGRNRIPLLHVPISLSAFLETIQVDLGFILSFKKSQPISVKSKASATSVAVLIGSEGGLSEAETTAALQKNFMPLSLGPRTLRTETATIVALSLLQNHYGDVSNSR